MNRTEYRKNNSSLRRFYRWSPASVEDFIEGSARPLVRDRASDEHILAWSVGMEPARLRPSAVADYALDLKLRRGRPVIGSACRSTYRAVLTGCGGFGKDLARGPKALP